jgi:hypothetical protein
MNATSGALSHQELQDHHIFPQAYLKRHGVTKRVDVNTIANRTLISNETNGKIKGKAPAAYLNDPAVFPSGARADLLGPHFLDGKPLAFLEDATEDLSDEALAELYDSFLQAREAAIIEEIRRACGIAPTAEPVEEDLEPDELAADVTEGWAPADEAAEELELDVA